MKSAADFLQEVFSAQLSPVKADSAKVLRRRNPEDLHDLRVDTLRTKFALKLLRDYAGIDRRKILHNRLKKFQDVMGQARNLDIVQARTAKHLQNLDVPAAQKLRIKKLIEARRRKAYAVLVKALQSNAYKRFLEKLQALGSAKQNPKPSTVAALTKTILEDYQRRVIKCKKRVRSPVDLHQVRIELKKLRYACEFFQDFYKGMGKSLKYILQFQDVLGERQDALSAIDRLKQFKGAAIQQLIGMEKTLALENQQKFETLWHKQPVKCLKILNFRA